MKKIIKYLLVVLTIILCVGCYNNSESKKEEKLMSGKVNVEIDVKDCKTAWLVIYIDNGDD